MHKLNFNPRSPHGERLLRRKAGFCQRQFQSTLPARGATYIGRALCPCIPISIHAPRTGSDIIDTFKASRFTISIHAPRTGSDLTRQRVTPPNAFQSTLPARGATGITGLLTPSSSTFQSTLPARGATSARRQRHRAVLISIHAPRTGSDFTPCCEMCPTTISIHAPRTGSDTFNGCVSIKRLSFQSTLPARGATHSA